MLCGGSIRNGDCKLITQKKLQVATSNNPVRVLGMNIMNDNSKSMELNILPQIKR